MPPIAAPRLIPRVPSETNLTRSSWATTESKPRATPRRVPGIEQRCANTWSSPAKISHIPTSLVALQVPRYSWDNTPRVPLLIRVSRAPVTPVIPQTWDQAPHRSGAFPRRSRLVSNPFGSIDCPLTGPRAPRFDPASMGLRLGTRSLFSWRQFATRHILARRVRCLEEPDRG